MAKEEKKALTPEDKKLEKDRKEREKRDNEVEEAKKKEKLKKKNDRLRRQKIREKKAKKLEKIEQKRINLTLKFPNVVLFNVSVLISVLTFIAVRFALESSWQTSLLYAFFVFAIFYIGFGIVMVGIFYLVSEDKKLEFEEQIRIEEEQKILDEKMRQESELADLEEIEREIANKRFNDKQSRELPWKTEETMPISPEPYIGGSQFEIDPIDSPAQLTTDTQSSSLNPIGLEIPSELPADDSQSGDDAYFDEIFGKMEK